MYTGGGDTRCFEELMSLDGWLDGQCESEETKLLSSTGLSILCRGGAAKVLDSTRPVPGFSLQAFNVI